MEFQAGAHTIRPVGEESLPELLALYRHCQDFLALGPDPIVSETMIRRDLETTQPQGGSFCGIYDPDGRLVGVLDVIPFGFEGDADTAFIELLMLAAPQRGRGLGAQVLQALETWLLEQGRARWMLAGVQMNNPGALRFWLREGFEPVSGPEEQPDGTVTVRVRKATGLPPPVIR